MKQYLKYSILSLLMSFYIFPVTFSAFSLANSKMILALMGLGVLGVHLWNKREIQFRKGMVMMSVLASIVSIIGCVSIVLNNTNDTAYAAYIVSAWVWLSAAYFVCSSIEQVHDDNLVEVICCYFIAVCVIQCLIALCVAYIPAFKQVLDSIVLQDQEALTKGKRLYGFGASLDTAGIRFAVSLSMIVYLVCKNAYKYSQFQTICFVLSYLLILVIGNMIARTTLVGFIVSVVLLLWLKRGDLLTYNIKIMFAFLTFVSIIVTISIVLYHSNEQFYSQIRFGFEPIFNYFEMGEFGTSSNRQLKNMFVFPDNIKTWIIGDGYFFNPNTIDPYYVGQTSKLGFYMGTDVGYSRLIFYFGLLGLLAFALFLVHTTKECCKNNPEYQILFWVIWILNVIIWFKVATDLFFVMALFACSGSLKEDKVLR